MTKSVAGATSRRWIGLGVVLSLLPIGIICLSPVPGGQVGNVRLCLLCGYQPIPNLVLNALLFLPFGFALRRAGLGLVRVVVVGVVLSASIEVVQAWVPGRFSAPADTLGNGTGAMLGALLGADPRRWVVPSPRMARGLGVVWVTVALSAVLTLGPLLVRVAPESTVYTGWTPRLGRLARYEGTVLDARVGDVTVPPAGYTPERLAHLARPGTEVALRFVVAPVGRRLAPLLHVTEGPRRDLLLVGVRSDDLVVRPRFRAQDVGLAGPEIVFRDVMSRFAVGDTVSVVLTEAPSGSYVLTAPAGVDVRTGVTAARGWSVWRYRQGAPEWYYVVLDLVWLAALVLPLAWWSGRLWQALTSSAVVALAMFAAAVVSPVLPPTIGYVAWMGVVSVTVVSTRNRLSASTVHS